MLGFGATGQFAIGEVQGFASTEDITPSRWFEALSEPARSRLGLKPSAQQFFAFNPQPVVSFSWMLPLAEPVRQRQRSAAAMAPFLFWQPSPNPFVATGWFQALSEPIRKRRGVLPPAQQFFATDVTVIPISKLIQWFEALSEPVRFRPGLRASMQQFLAAPSRILPTPTTSGVLAALESKDAFLGGSFIWDRVTGAEIGVVDTSYFGTEIGILGEAGADQSAAITSVQVSISIL